LPTPEKIEPQKVTKPIQLLAAWLVGLIVVDGGFLTTAVQLGTVGWECGALIIAAIVNVPLFLFALFLLQTRYRPELQEDVFYSQYLDKKTNTIVRMGRDEAFDKELTAIRAELRLLTSETERRLAQQRPAISQLGVRWRVALNKHLSDFDRLHALLEERDILLSDIFGVPTPPPARHVAMADFLDFPSKLEVLRLAVEMKMDAYTYFDPIEEEIDEQVLIGSYGPAPFPITPELHGLLQSEPDESDLLVYERRYSKDSQQIIGRERRERV
jgi:hypothetical protein